MLPGTSQGRKPFSERWVEVAGYSIQPMLLIFVLPSYSQMSRHPGSARVQCSRVAYECA